MRLVYENESDRVAERAVMGYFAKYCNASRFVKLPVSYEIDFAMVDRWDAVTGWAEVKVRNCGREKYRTFFIALRKWMSMARVYDRTGIPCWLLVSWTDGLGALKVYPEFSPIDVIVGGRTDRDDPADLEPMVHVSVAAFDFFPGVLTDRPLRAK